MKAFIILISPVIILLAACALLSAEWYYYIIALVVGNGFGALALLAYWQVRDNSDKPIIKIYKDDSKVSN